MRGPAVIPFIALSLASCGSGGDAASETSGSDIAASDIEAADGDTQFRISGEDGEEMVINTGSGADVDLPEGYSIYPGASVTGTTTISQADGQGTMVMMQSADSPEEMAAYYRKQAEAAGITIQMEMNTNGSRMVGGEDDAGGTFSFNASPTEEGSIGQLVVGRDMN